MNGVLGTLDTFSTCPKSSHCTADPTEQIRSATTSTDFEDLFLDLPSPSWLKHLSGWDPREQATRNPFEGVVLDAQIHPSSF